MDAPASVAAVVLAAGAASRFGSPKQRLLLPRVLERISPLLELGVLSDIVVVEGAYTVHDVVDASSSARVGFVRCEDWELGPGASLRCGLRSLGPEIAAAVVVLADGPTLAPEAVERVIAAWAARGGDVVTATYGGTRGHPLLAARAAWGSIPDEGLRSLAAEPVPCDDLGDPGDVDVPANLAPDA